MNIQELNAFLHYGYIPNKSLANFDSLLPVDIDKIEARKKKWQNITVAEIVEHGSYYLRKVIDGDQSLQGLNIVPLSGGLDSRAILGLLLERYPKNQIKTITCGIPGTWDYEIGIQIAKKNNIDFKTIDLRTISWATDELVNFAQNFLSPIVLTDAFMYSKIITAVEDDPIYWIGFMGDPLAGSHLPKIEVSEWKDVCTYFIEKESFLKKNLLAQLDFNPLNFLPDKPIWDSYKLSNVEQLDFAVRQKQFIKPQLLLGNHNYRTPFLNETWVNFALSMPNDLRMNQFAYKKILKFTFPDLFILPTKNNAGLPLGASKGRRYITIAKEQAKKRLYNIGMLKNYVNPNINYVDFEKEFKKGSLKTVTQNNLKDLSKRDIVNWIDIDAIWKKHQKGENDLSKQLALLLSLEIHLKAGNFK